MRIDKDSPLPEHTILDYDECCACLILREIFVERYKGLDVKDKPDLQCQAIGIEVTKSADKKHQEAINNWVMANNCEEVSKRKHYVERMEQLGEKYTEGIQFWSNYHPSLNDLFKSIDNKIDKIRKGNYASFPQYELFVFTDLKIYDENKTRIKEHLLANRFFDNYSRLYILEKGYLLFLFEAEYDELIELNITEQTERNLRARQMVEEAEEEV